MLPGVGFELAIPRSFKTCSFPNKNAAHRGRHSLFGSGGPLWALLAQDSKATVTRYCQFLCSECLLFPKAVIQMIRNTRF
jgi:hypothetical protein